MNLLNDPLVRRYRVLIGVLIALSVAYTIAMVRAHVAPEHPFYATLPTDRPLVIAHQGGEWLYPSSTMLAFENAVAMGVDILEMDIHSTRDGVLVTIHDATVDRTTDGTGRVNDLTLADINQLDAGYYWTEDEGETYPFRGQGLQIGKLEEIFQAFPDMPMNIEIKQVEPSIAQPFCDLIRQYGKSEQVLVASFNQQPMDEFRAACPEVATSFVTREVITFYAHHLLFGARSATPPAGTAQLPEFRFNIHVLTPRFIRAAHNRNVQVHAWTINDVETMQRMLDLGVDGIITDRPDLLLELLE